MDAFSPSSGRIYRQYRIEIKANYTYKCCNKQVVNREDFVLYEFGPNSELDKLLYEPYKLANVVFARRVKKKLYTPEGKREIDDILNYLYKFSSLGINDLPCGTVKSLCVMPFEKRFYQLLSLTALDRIVDDIRNWENLPQDSKVNVAPYGVIVQCFREGPNRPHTSNIVKKECKCSILKSHRAKLLRRRFGNGAGVHVGEDN